MNFRTPALIDAALRSRLVVSCQPVDRGPMDLDDIVVALAAAAIAGGAGGVRIESARRVAAVSRVLDAPIIGIVKRDLADSPVRITPFLEDVAELAAAGADIIAVDATARPRPVSVAKLLEHIRSLGVLGMADCSNVEEALAAHQLGFDVVGTTLSGYVGGDIPAGPDIAFIRAISARMPRVMAEGRFNAPASAAAAIDAGAWSVTVGTAITRTEVVTGWFADALKA
ncbi:MAG: putative N-acetylmannosamine-6-phosphate 2-epimerase [Rhodocyclaceae bacterium]|nr:putative N-acetylmannosamine-6-phosphate 2-epimerase [Rhodocyclaceae bacterium]MCA3025782.1 putative N-acetylmannosamine-6-phosphate 2-epimerase [Rhodocyclaceae bacterium]MCA3031815.1 putative N-acetylmannosamine-6-phosphate 2-epimerase [Rhodocyclaceae bacterium]MCA3038123.1 putative N-acetylmannosamine-6-phosphate 2-epimerase [Rhodocyclaceae bacterium]MCA3045708.1 putative N-acetylmannosamine-6-phosphate 2-epimerase [Rhodocyclaceae bacterium]